MATAKAEEPETYSFSEQLRLDKEARKAAKAEAEGAQGGVLGVGVGEGGYKSVDWNRVRTLIESRSFAEFKLSGGRGLGFRLHLDKDRLAARVSYLKRSERWEYAWHRHMGLDAETPAVVEARLEAAIRAAVFESAEEMNQLFPGF